MKILLAIFGLLVFGQSAFGADLQAAADDVCACLEGPYARMQQFMAEMEKVQASGDYSKLMPLQSEIKGTVDESSLCFQELPSKYPEIDRDEELQKRVMAIVDRQCPNPAEEWRPQS